MRLWADQIVINRTIIEARGDVYIRQDQYSLFAGYIHIDLITKSIIAKHNVLVEFNNTFVSGNQLWLDIQTQKAKVHKGTLFYEPGSLYMKGNIIEKTGRNTFYVDKMLVTGCDLCNPDWSISGNDVHITIDGYARIWHGRMSVKNVPIFYTPFFIFPVKQDRQTGLLLPFVEHSSRKGWLYQQPFYWVIGNSYDATLYTTFLEKCGIMNGLEFRYNISPQSTGTFMFDYLNDRQQDSVNNQSQRGYLNDEYLRENSERYWIRMKIDQNLLFNTKFHLDIDRISDPDYLKTFETGYTGFVTSRNSLFHRHHRDIDDADERFRFNRMMIARRFESSKIYGEFQWFDDVYHHNYTENELPVHQLPVIRFSSIQSPLRYFPIFLDLDTQYAYEFQKEAEKRHHLYMASALTLPLDIFPYLSIEQSFQWKGGYSHSHSHQMSAQQNTFKTSITSELYKIYSFGSNHAKTKAKKLFKHSIRLVTAYAYVPNVKENWKYFRLFDEASNKIKWSLTNSWIEKKTKNQSRKDTSTAEYKQRVNLVFSGYYEILEDNEQSLSDQNGNQAISPIKMDFFWHADTFSFNADTLWSVYNDELLQYHMALDLNNPDDKQLKIHYQYCKDRNESIDSEISALLHPRFKILASYSHDIHNNQRIQNALGLEYTGPCWRLNGMYNDKADTNDRSLSVMIHLNGISN